VAGALLTTLVLGCTGDGDFVPGTTVRVERGRIERIVVATGTVARR
jgi:hypothetical protein